MSADTPAFETQIIDFVRGELGVDVPELDADTALVTTGLVDSVGLVRIATFIENLLAIRIPDRDIQAENFETVRRMEAYVQKRRTH
jgi:acyl carrier protein